MKFNNTILRIFFFVVLLALPSWLVGQGYTLEGRVLDMHDHPLPGALVYMQYAQKSAVSDAQGYYVINDISANNYTLATSFLGYHTQVDSLGITQDTQYDIHLSASTLHLQEVVVHDHYAEERKRDAALNVEIVNEDYLKQNMGGSLMKSLERLPGVSTIDIGSGQSKPVIRGLSFNRVVVVENNVKHEAQQWGSDHGLEIDQYAIADVEVIKGPASLIYGSDAIGGVIDMSSAKVPAQNTFGGSVNLTGKSNNNFMGTSVALHGRKEWFYADLRATLLDYGDYKVPTDSVEIYSYKAPLHNNQMRNTAGEELNLHLALGLIFPRFQNTLRLSNVNNKNGFFANAHGLEPRNVDTDLHDASSRDILYPYQQVSHFKAINNTHWSIGELSLKSNIGYQHNLRSEWSEYTSHGYMPPVYPDSIGGDAELERQFYKHVYTADVKGSYDFNEKSKLSLGLNTEYQDNDIAGRGFIIPAYDRLNFGTFAYAQHRLSENSILSAGLRWDYGRLKIQEYYDWYPSEVDGTEEYLQRAEALDRQYSNFSWSLGYNYNTTAWTYKAHIGKSFRMPLAKELAANGVNYHQFSYERGNADLSPEESYQLDVGIEYHAEAFAIGATPFFNYFSNYIYLNPTSEYDRLYGNGNQVYEYTESEVLRFGAEIHAHYQILQSLQLGLIGEYVYSEQLTGPKKGYTLPFSPPASAIINLKYQTHEWLGMEHVYASLDYRITAAQNHIVPPEEKTEGYQVFNLGLGGEVYINEQPLILSLQVQNLLNTKYFNHTSFYRLINVPEIGRNFIMNVSIPIGSK